jgi:hypothetical protein
MLVKLSRILAALPTLSKPDFKANFDAITNAVGAASAGVLDAGNFARTSFIDNAALFEPNHILPLTIALPSIAAYNTAYTATACIPDTSVPTTIAKGMVTDKAYLVFGPDSANSTSYSLNDVNVTMACAGTSVGPGDVGTMTANSPYVINWFINGYVTAVPGTVVTVTVRVVSGTATLPLVNCVANLYFKGNHLA